MALRFTVEDGTLVPHANSYCSVETADDYWDEQPPGASTFVGGPSGAVAWSELTTVEKQQRLILATRMLDEIITWAGTRFVGHPDTLSQKRQWLEWPRYDMFDRTESYEIEAETIPVALQQATAEYAGQLGDKSRTEDDAAENVGMTRLSAGEVNFDFDPLQKTVPNRVLYMLYPNWIADYRQRSRRTLQTVRLR